MYVVSSLYISKNRSPALVRDDQLRKLVPLTRMITLFDDYLFIHLMLPIAVVVSYESVNY